MAYRAKFLIFCFVLTFCPMWYFSQKHDHYIIRDSIEFLTFVCLEHFMRSTFISKSLFCWMWNLSKKPYMNALM